MVLNGVNHAGNGITRQGRFDLEISDTDAASRTPFVTFSAISDLGGLTLASGVYGDPSSFFLTGILTLDGAVTLDNNILLVPEPNSSTLLGVGLALLGLARRRRRSR